MAAMQRTKGAAGHGTDHESQPASTLSADADALATVLKLYRGWATPEELAKKAGLGSPERVLVAAQELAGKGLSLIERGMVKPTTSGEVAFWRL